DEGGASLLDAAAVVAAARAGGFPAGVLASALAALVCTAVENPVAPPPGLSRPGEWALAGLFLAEGVFLSAVTAALGSDRRPVGRPWLWRYGAALAIVAGAGGGQGMGGPPPPPPPPLPPPPPAGGARPPRPP